MDATQSLWKRCKQLTKSYAKKIEQKEAKKKEKLSTVKDKTGIRRNKWEIKVGGII